MGAKLGDWRPSFRNEKHRLRDASSDSAQHHKNDNDDQDGSKDTYAAVTIPVTIAAESTTEATQ
jgi:hypothetical protein